MSTITMRDFLDAIVNNNIGLIDRFLQSSLVTLDVEIPYRNGRTIPLHLACYLGRLAAADRLIKAQADVNLQTKNGESPLFFAVQNGHLELVKLLIAAQADVDLAQFQGAAPLHIAAQDDWHIVVDHLAKAQADLNLREINGCSPLYIACQEGSSRFVHTLIKAGADVNLPTYTGETPLYSAVQTNELKIAKQLIDALADVNLQEYDDGWTPACMASQEGYVKALKLLLEAQADVNIQSKDGKTALFIAALGGHYNIAEMLLVRTQADVNIRTNDGRSALYVAASKGHRKLVKLLIEAQADTEAQTSHLKAPLHAAVENGHQQIVQMLINSMANPDCSSETGQTPLNLAIQADHFGMVQMLIESQTDINIKYSGKTAVHTAMDKGLSRLSNLLIERSANLDTLNDAKFAAIHLAAQSGCFELVKALIKYNADVNVRGPSGATPAYLASQEEHVEVLSEMIRASADIDIGAKEKATPIYIASQNGSHKVVRTLIRAQADVNRQVLTGQSPLYIACQNGHRKVVLELLKARADVEAKDEDGFTALYMAAQFGHQEVVKALVQSQADVNVVWSFSLAPLHIASQQNHLEVVDLLVEAQADVDVRRDTSETPLHLAVHWGHGQVVSLLLKAQAELNFQEVGGYSPLLIASQGGHADIAKQIISAGADTDLRTSAGKSSLHIAAKFGHQRVVELLLEARSNIGPRTFDGKTPLDLSMAQNHSNVTRLLMDAQEKYDSGLNSPISEEKNNGVSFLGSDNCIQPLNSNDQFINLSKKFRELPEDTELSLRLQSDLTHSGFVDSRAAMQSAISDVLEKILRNRLNDDEVFVVGSYSEGWGNSLVRLNGRTDLESDIDVVQLMPGRLYHIAGHCNCLNPKTPQTEYDNGHIGCEGFASNPARPENGSSLRPAVDRVSACRLCCYPPIAPLQPHRLAKSNIPQSVLDSLARELETSPCHVVHAAPPGQAGKQLRVSTTFLERRLLRSLNTLQGQLFVTLKYLVKKVIGRRVQGLKAYHAKTVTFRMVEETPAEQWKPENLVALTRRSVQMLLGSVESSCTTGNVDGRIMEHFFLSDAALYLKGADRSSSLEICRVLRDVIDKLPELLARFIETLKPVGNAGIFYFHPFLIIPIILWNPDQKKTNEASFHKIYNTVKDLLITIFERNESDRAVESLLDQIDTLPNCATAARTCLHVLACLKLGDRVAAIQVLNKYRGHAVCRGLDWPDDRTPAEATPAAVWRHLEAQDSAWKFCFKLDRLPSRSILAEVFANHSLRECFPLSMENFQNFFYMNFDALLQCLRRELAPEDASFEEWMNELSNGDDADEVELIVHSHYLGA